MAWRVDLNGLVIGAEMEDHAQIEAEVKDDVSAESRRDSHSLCPAARGDVVTRGARRERLPEPRATLAETWEARPRNRREGRDDFERRVWSPAALRCTGVAFRRGGNDLDSRTAVFPTSALETDGGRCLLLIGRRRDDVLCRRLKVTARCGTTLPVLPEDVTGLAAHLARCCDPEAPRMDVGAYRRNPVVSELRVSSKSEFRGRESVPPDVSMGASTSKGAVASS
ncbi:hypothetical protein HPB51_017040 [Rhipicephalus microplus]|uniref:Uncharacterized protein n=1 Tax=Rhipicephalus microplus TaxID=6941 RepID=A0A9J6F4H5_RHIMP|nr:hypothetical protein HPB51_017040 [Rhipicephalus microplus]